MPAEVLESPTEPTALDAAPPEGTWRRRHPVLAFLVRSIPARLLTLLAASVLIFLAVHALPGDVAQMLVGRSCENCPAADRAAQIRADLGLDDPLPQRYGQWLGGMVTGDFGNSSAALAQGSVRPVWGEISRPLTNTLVLAAITTVLFIIVSLVLGAWAARHAGKPPDRVVSTTALGVGALPEFTVGTLLIAVFFTWLGWLPPISQIPRGDSPLAHPDRMVLPILTLLLFAAGYGVRLVRASTLEVLREDYVAMADINGYSGRQIFLRDVLRNALSPNIQVLAQTLRYLIGGVIIVEALFNYPGIGQALVQAVQLRDVQQLAVIAMLLSTVSIAITLFSDLAMLLLVPKLRTAA